LNDKKPVVFSEAPLVAKRRLLNIVIEDICCSAERGKKTGEIIYKLRGDGTVMMKWEAAKENEESGNAYDGGSARPVTCW
jgi:hypothetical protein